MSTRPSDGTPAPRRICVFCASSTGSSPEYAELASRVGRTLVERGYGVVYGGANRGLMGEVADAALEAIQLMGGSGSLWEVNLYLPYLRGLLAGTPTSDGENTTDRILKPCSVASAGMAPAHTDLSTSICFAKMLLNTMSSKPATHS